MKSPATFKIIRLSGAAVCFLIGLAALIAFEWLVGQLSFLSPDGTIGARTLLELRICLFSLLPIGIGLAFSRYLWSGFSSLGRLVDSLSQRRFLLTLLVTAAAWRVLPPLLMDVHLISDYGTYDELAWTWATMGGYLDDCQATGYYPPGYPYFLSRIYLLAGHTPLAGAAANVLLSVLMVYLTWRLASDLVGNNAARWAGILMAFFPSQILFVNLLASEMVFTPLLLLSLLLCIRAAKSSRLNWLLAAGSGILLGLATLCRALTQVFWVIPLIHIWLSSKNRPATLRRGGLLLLGFVLLVAPWMIRNHNTVGRAVISTNGGINLMIGNNPHSGMGYTQVDVAVFDFSIPRGEKYSDSVGYEKGRAYILAHPITFLKRGVAKVAYLFATDMVGLFYEINHAARHDVVTGHVWLAGISQVYYLAILLLACGGMLRLLKSKRCVEETLLIWGPILFWMAVHFVYFGDARFHFPIMPLACVLAGVCIAAKIKPD